MALTDPRMDADEDLDALGLLCPLPVLKAAKRLRGMSPGATLRILTDDPAAIVDIPHFCNEKGYELVGTSETDSHQVHFIRKT